MLAYTHRLDSELRSSVSAASRTYHHTVAPRSARDAAEERLIGEHAAVRSADGVRH
jgi:hypothetical protein